MKKLVFFLLLPLCLGAAIPQLSSAQTSDSASAIKFVSLNAAGKYSEAQGMFAPSLQSQLSPEILQSIWEGLEKKYGSFEAVAGMTQMRQDSFNVLLPICNFRNAQLTLSLAFGPSKLLFGYRIVNVKEKEVPVSLIPDTKSVDTSVQVTGGKIYGTLLIPDTAAAIPVALIIAGSGATDRNGNSGVALQGNSYRMLADSLAVHGIASLRYDKRYVGHSTGFTAPVQDLRFNDYVDDAVALIHFLKADKKFSQIIVIGHSEGSLIGMLAADKTKADAYISLSGMGETFDKVIAWQMAQQPGATKALETNVKNIVDSIRRGITVEDVPANLQVLFRPSVQPYLTSLMKYNPAKAIKNLTMPVLIVNGTTDIQVTVAQAKLLHAAKPDAQLAVIPGMNHILKDAPADRTENIATYQNPDLPLNPMLIQRIVSFIYSLPLHNHS